MRLQFLDPLRPACLPACLPSRDTPGNLTHLIPPLPDPPPGPEFRENALDFQAKVHDVAVKILKALFIGLGRDESLIDEVGVQLPCALSTGQPTGWAPCSSAAVPPACLPPNTCCPFLSNSAALRHQLGGESIVHCMEQIPRCVAQRCTRVLVPPAAAGKIPRLCSSSIQGRKGTCSL